MAVNFPNNPTTNQTFTVGAKTWIWNGYAWDLQVANTVGVTAFAQQAFNTANSASSNTIYTQGVDATQNTNITNLTNWLSANISYISGVDSSQNTSIVNANTQLKSYTDGAIASANNQLKSYVDGQVSSVLNYSNGIDNNQNTRISTVEANTVYLSGALNQTNTSIVNANTQLKAYTDGSISSANTQLKSYVDGQVSSTLSYISGVDNAQNTRITTVESNTVYLQGALNQTNTNIVNANTQLKAYTDGQIGIVLNYSNGIDVAQNTRLSTVEANTIYLFGALNQTNTNIVNANTQLKAYTDGAISSANTQLKAYTDGVIASANTQLKAYTDGAIASANTQLKAYTDGFITYGSGVDTTQNTRITNVEANTVYLFGALNQTNTNISSANTQLKAYTDALVSSSVSSANTQLKSYVDAADALKFNVSGGTITGPVTISSNLTVTGNLTVAGSVTTVSANNLMLKDNMIYLNDGSVVANPDLGIAGNYNDGTYRHAGFFRDASDGYWKVYDQYLPEPDASPYIDTSNSSFRIADFQANNVTFGKISTSSTLLVTNLNADLFDGQHGTYYSPLTFTQQAFDAANNSLTYGNGVNTAQNTRISTVEANTVYLFGALNQTNTNITSANTQLKAYTDGAIASANTQLKAYTDGLISYVAGVDAAQNTRLSTVEANTVYLFGALNQTNTNITSSNTQLKAYTDGAIASANTQLKAYTDAFITYGSGVDAAQNTNITGATTLAQAAYNQANTDYTTISTTAGDYGSTTIVPVIKLTANGRISSVTNASISFPVTSVGGAGVTGAVSNTQLLASIIAVDGAGSGLDADLLDGQHATYYSPVTFTQAAYNQANTDYTTVSVTAGSYGGTTSVPVVTVAANGRISAISSTSISSGATITDDTTSNATRYIMLGQSTSGSYTVANTSSTKLTYNPSTGTLNTSALLSSSLNSIAGTALSVDSGTTGALNIGTTASAKTITLGNATGATTLIANSGTGGVTFNQVAGGQFAVKSTGIPSSDMFNITNIGYPVTTAGVNNIELDYYGGSAAVEAGAQRIALYAGNTASGVWNALRIVPGYAAAPSVVQNGIKFDSISVANTGTDNMIYASTGWDNILNYNGTSLINGTGQINASQILTGTVPTASLGSGTANANTYLTGASTWATLSAPVRQTFTATAGQTSFTVSGGYAANVIDVYKNGAKLVNGTDVTVTSGTAVVLTLGAAAGDIIDVVGSSTAYSLTSTITAGNLTGTIPSGVLGNSTLYIGTTAVPLNATNNSITSLNVSISGSNISGGTIPAGVSYASLPAGNLTGTIPTSVAWASLAAGTVMTFRQSTAPTGWTKVITYDDSALRVVSGNVSNGGTVNFSAAFSATNTVDNTTLTTTQIPSHSHGGATGGMSGNNPHNHYTQLNDPGHSHGIGDPTHTHTYLVPTPSSVFQVGPYSAQYTRPSGSTGASYTGVYTGGSGTGISLGAASNGWGSTTDIAHTHGITAEGGGGAHNHTTANFAVKYVDLILASKN